MRQQVQVLQARVRVLEASSGQDVEKEGAQEDAVDADWNYCEEEDVCCENMPALLPHTVSICNGPHLFTV